MERVWKNKSKDQKALESAIEFFLLSTATAVTVTIAGFARARAICVKLPISQRQTQYTTMKRESFRNGLRYGSFVGGFVLCDIGIRFIREEDKPLNKAIAGAIAGGTFGHFYGRGAIPGMIVVSTLGWIGGVCQETMARKFMGKDRLGMFNSKLILADASVAETKTVRIPLTKGDRYFEIVVPSHMSDEDAKNAAIEHFQSLLSGPKQTHPDGLDSSKLLSIEK